MGRNGFGINLSELVQIGLYLSQIVKTCPNSSRLVWTWLKLSKIAYPRNSICRSSWEYRVLCMHPRQKDSGMWWIRLRLKKKLKFTGKDLSEVLIYSSINPQYDNRLFNDLQVQYKKLPISEHVENMLCTQTVLNIKTINMRTCSK